MNINIIQTFLYLYHFIGEILIELKMIEFVMFSFKFVLDAKYINFLQILEISYSEN